MAGQCTTYIDCIIHYASYTLHNYDILFFASINMFESSETYMLQ